MSEYRKDVQIGMDGNVWVNVYKDDVDIGSESWFVFFPFQLEGYLKKGHKWADKRIEIAKKLTT